MLDSLVVQDDCGTEIFSGSVSGVTVHLPLYALLEVSAPKPPVPKNRRTFDWFRMMQGPCLLRCRRIFGFRVDRREE